jgi:hypothetical protein
MKRIITLLAAALSFAFAAPVLAADAAGASNTPDAATAPGATQTTTPGATQAADDALADKADVPAKPPVLPSTASDRATYVHDNIAFGKKGAAERAAHSQADRQGATDTDDAHAEAANRAAHAAAASAAAAANGDSHAAAGQARVRTARTSRTGGTTTTTTTTPGATATAPTMPTRR